MVIFIYLLLGRVSGWVGVRVGVEGYGVWGSGGEGLYEKDKTLEGGTKHHKDNKL